MGNYMKQTEAREERKEKDKTSRETLGKFFYDLAKTTFAVMVLGNIATVLIEKVNLYITVLMMVLGLFVTYLFAYTGNKILKS